MFSSTSPPVLQEQSVFFTLSGVLYITLTYFVLGHMTIQCYTINFISTIVYVVNRLTAVGKQSRLFFSRPLCLSCFDSFLTDFKAKRNDGHMNLEVSIATKTRLFITAAPKI